MPDPAQTPTPAQDGNPPESAGAGQEQGKPDTTPQTPQSQDEVAELRAKLKRLESTNQGNYQEYMREKSERERIQGMLAQYQQQQMQYQQRPAEPNDEDLAAAESDAILEGNKAKLAEIRRMQREKAKREALEEVDRRQQWSQAQYAQDTAIREFLASSGVKSSDPNDPAFRAISEKANEISRDNAFRFAHGNPAMIAVLAAQEVRAQQRYSRAKEEEKARTERVSESFTEGDTGKGSGSPPGQKKPKEDKMYFKESERRLIERMAEHQGTSVADAERKYWSHIPEEVRNRRVSEQKAI